MASFWENVKDNRRLFWAYVPLILLYATSYFQRIGIPGTIFNELSKEYGFTAVQIAGIGTSFVCVYSICQLFVGMLADKFCGIRVITWGGLIFCIGVIGFPLVCGNLWAMYAMRFLTGLGASSMYLSIVKETDRLFGRQNYSVFLGIVYFVGYSGGLFGTYPFERLNNHFNWINVLLVIGVVSVAMYLIVIFTKRIIPPGPIAKTNISFKPLLYFLKNRYMLMLIFCSSIVFSTYSTIQMVFGKKFLQDYVGLSSAGAAKVIFFQTFTCMLTLLGFGTLIRLMGNRRKPQMIFSASLAFLNTLGMVLVMKYGLPSALFVAGFLLYSVASGSAVAFSLVAQEINARDTMTQATGLNNLSNYLFVAIGPLLIGKLLDSYVSQNVLVEGQAVVYPAEAYQMVFLLLLIPTGIAVLMSFFLPETRGHYLHQHLPG
ncbi:MAG: MFS transporter [Lentisphaeria bacterium]|nr:MFS transporter [Lentisphaeria bacterium]